MSVVLFSCAAAELKFIWQAEVQSERIKVYSEASREKPVVVVLSKGDFLNVILEISVLNDRWCRVVVVGQSEPAGYVLCSELRMRRFEPNQSAAIQPTKITRKTAVDAPISPATGNVNTASILRNQDIVDMSKAGLPDSVLIAKINSSSCEFDTTVARLKELKGSGVPDAVLLAMVEYLPGQPKALGATNVNPVTSPAHQPPATDNSPADLSIPSGSKVFIEPMNGYEIYLSAALQKKHVPIAVITQKDKADFIITGDSDTKKAGWAKIVFMGNLHSDEEASVTMVNNKTGVVVFAYAVNKKNTLHGQQTSAEACAKHLKNRIEKRE